MSDPTSAINQSVAVDTNLLDFQIKNAEALVVGGFVGLNLSTGKVEFMDDIDSLISLGYVVGAKDGDNVSGLTGDSGGTKYAVARSGEIIKNYSVTGASAVTDIGKAVYCTDGQTLTLTKPTAGKPIGYVVKWNTSTYCDIYLLTPYQQMIASQDGHKEVMFLGYVGTNVLDGNALTLLKITAHTHFKITKFYALPSAYDTGIIAGAKDLSLEIDDVAVTGGVISLAYTNCDASGDIGTAVAGTAITATNEVHEGDVIDVVSNAGTGFTAAKVAGFNLYLEIVRLAGA